MSMNTKINERKGKERKEERVEKCSMCQHVRTWRGREKERLSSRREGYLEVPAGA